jgi:hypothetical protein
MVMGLQAFRQCDVDNSGRIDIKELHIGLLILYDKINSVLPIHYPIPTKHEVRIRLTKIIAVLPIQYVIFQPIRGCKSYRQLTGS